MPKDGRRDLVKKGLERGGILKIVIARGGGGVQFLYVIITFLKTPTPLWDVINDQFPRCFRTSSRKGPPVTQFLSATTSPNCPLILFIIWLNPLAGKIKQILHSDWLPKQTRWAHFCLCVISSVGSVSKHSLFGHTINSLLTKLFWSRWLNIGLLFCIFFLLRPQVINLRSGSIFVSFCK